jgi:hypothetical protein
LQLPEFVLLRKFTIVHGPGQTGILNCGEPVPMHQDRLAVWEPELLVRSGPGPPSRADPLGAVGPGLLWCWVSGAAGGAWPAGFGCAGSANPARIGRDDLVARDRYDVPLRHECGLAARALTSQHGTKRSVGRRPGRGGGLAGEGRARPDQPADSY